MQAPTPRHPSSGRSQRRGFSLVELLVVVAFIAILAAIAIPRYTAVSGRSHDAKVKSDIRNALQLEEQYYGQEGSYVEFTVEAGRRADPPGFAPSPGVAVTATIPASGGVMIVGRHPGASTSWCVSQESGAVVAGDSC